MGLRTPLFDTHVAAGPAPSTSALGHARQLRLAIEEHHAVRRDAACSTFRTCAWSTCAATVLRDYLRRSPRQRRRQAD